MRTLKYVLGFMIIAAVFLIGCENLQNSLNLKKPAARLTGLKFENVNQDSATLLFDVDVENPYSVDLPLVNLDYDLTTHAKPFLAGQADLQTTIPANSTKAVALPVQINYLEMLKALQGVRPGTNIPYKADLGLSVKAPVLGPLRLPLKKEGQVTLPTLSDIDPNLIWDMLKNK